MELSEWCEQVPHGQYFQPIRLRVETAASATPLAPTASANAAAPSDEPSTPPPQGLDAESSPTITTPKRLKRRQKPPPSQTPKSTSDDDGVVLLPPFQSAQVGTNRTVLNVGGPVWAMDWLPHDVYRLTSTIATKSKKRNAPANGKANKENVDGNANGALRENGKLNKDPLAGWRVLALATHPPCTVVDGKLVKNTPPDHHYDAPRGGRNMIQIWAIPVASKSAVRVKQEEGDQSKDQDPPEMIPRLVYAIDHDSGVAWDVHWSPLTYKMARYRQSNDLLGLLAVAFGDGSLQIFEVPLISPDKLQVEPSEHVVERLSPIAAGKLERIIQLSVRWSPHRSNLLLTGCSDGSVALWNLEELLSKALPTEGLNETHELEPQRRFQDADTIGKQEPFDWGWGWVAVRAVSWSPFDENLFATTGNDSLFKLWDIRESRICFRSHRIRSTWGLAMQWMDDTSVQISGDQGSLYMYDVLSGSHQKLHFHPQIDSPVWDLQFARRGRFPILLSSCTSGSLRVAPAKKIFRAPQHSVEFCRLHGEKNANVEQPHKSLTVNFDHRIVSGSAEAASPATREFCERDASLHRVRLSTSESGEYPCFLATGGHAGLVILMEMQDDFDNLFDNYFLLPSKKIGRPRKSGTPSSPWGGRNIGQEKPKKLVTPLKAKRVSGIKLSSFARGNGLTPKSKSKHKKAKDDGLPELPEVSASPSEPEYQDGESESDSDEISLGDDNSDDDRVIPSDEDDDFEEVEAVSSPVSSNVARMRHEYQMDLSEEDAVLLAIQMSELEHTPNPPSAKEIERSVLPTEESVAAKADKTVRTKEEDKLGREAAAGTLNGTSSRSKLSSNGVGGGTSGKAKSSKDVASAGDTSKRVGASKKSSGRVVQAEPDWASYEAEELLAGNMDQTSIQMHIYQQGMTEEDALREALRMSEVGHMRRSNRKRKAPSPSPDEGFLVTPTSKLTPKARKRPTPTPKSATSTPLAATTAAVALSPDEVARRLEFTNTSPQQGAAAVPAPGCISPSEDTPKPSRPLKTPPLPPKPRSNSTSSAKKKTPKVSTSEESPGPSQPPNVTTPKQTNRKTTTTPPSTKRTPSSSSNKAKPKRASGGGASFLSEEELLAIALQTSQIEY